MAVWLEQLRQFFVLASALQGRSTLPNHRPVRVIEFRSAAEYSAFQPRPTADAFFVGDGSFDYIVMPRSGAAEFQVAAHEYAHVILHSLSVQLPPWFAEGLAELFSTVRISGNGCFLGGDLSMRSLTLRQTPWIPLPKLLGLTVNASAQLDRHQTDIFYAESWALTQMLAFSAAYQAHFRELWSALSSGTVDGNAISALYGKSLGAIAADLRVWAAAPKTSIPLPGVPVADRELRVSSLPNFESRLIMADLLLICSDLNRAEAAYQALAKERPDDPRAAAALGNIALKRGDATTAREHWERAMQLGIKDAALCYRYAVSAENAGLPAEDMMAALQRAIELDPDFDDARYRLGLAECNRGAYQAAIEQLRAIHSVPAGRAYGYWSAMASALTAIDQREQARQAAETALRYASNRNEHDAALRLAYVAQTDLTVQFARDANGNAQVVTARKPHGSNDWNPFIEPSDRIRSLTGRIRAVECVAGQITGFRIEGTSAAVRVALPDPSHVLISGGTAEFVCGSEDGRTVVIQYAASDKPGRDGVLRGLQFQ